MKHLSTSRGSWLAVAVLATLSACTPGTSDPQTSNPTATSATISPPITSSSTTPSTEPTPRSAARSIPALDRSAVDRLRTGGYVIFFRHASTDRSQSDNENGNYDNCARQRNLTDSGRQQARAIGDAIRTLVIPVGRVIASPYCRTRETAQLAFGDYERVQTYNATEALTSRILATPATTGTNTVIVAHGFIVRDLFGVTIAEGDAVVFQPTGPDNPGIVGTVTAGNWTEWATS